MDTTVEQKQNTLKIALVAVSVFMLVYMGWFGFTAYKEITKIAEDTETYNQLLLEQISEKSKMQLDKVNKINGK